MKRLLLVCISNLFFLSFLSGEVIYFQTLGQRHGLSQSSAMSIWQDYSGKMWIGNNALNKYDGENIGIYRLSEFFQEVEDSDIHALCGNDSILFFLAEQHLICFDLNLETFMLPGIDTRAICESGGRVYYGSEQTFCAYDPGSGEKEEIISLPSRSARVVSILEVGDQLFWVGTSEGVYVIDAANRTLVTSFLENEYIPLLYQDTKGFIWVICQSKNIYLYHKEKHPTPVCLNTVLSQPLQIESAIYSIQEDVLGFIWIGTLSGIYRLKRTEASDSLTFQDHILSESSVYSLFSDHQGNIWIGSYYGDVRYYNPRMDNYIYYSTAENHPNWLHGAAISRITEDKDGTLYCATEGSGINVQKVGQNAFEHITTEDGLAQNKIRELWYDEDYNRLYISVYMEGLCYLDLLSNKIIPIRDEMLSTLHQRIIEQIIPYKEHLILHTQNGLFTLDRKTLKISRFFEDDEMDKQCSGIIRTMYIDDQDILWVSSYQRGLFTIDLKRNKLLNTYGDGIKEMSKVPSAIINICGDSKRGLFFVTLKSGILKYEATSDSFIQFNETNRQLLSDICYNIAFTQRDNLILTSDKGVSLLQITPDHTVKALHHILINQSSPQMVFTGDCGLYVSQRKDYIYVGGLYGLLCFSEKDLSQDEGLYSLYFSYLQINNEPIPPTSPILQGHFCKTKKLNLDYNQNSLNITFASSNYLSSRTMQYEYKLEGWDDFWTRTSHKNIIYNSLRPGSYHLIVREVENPDKKLELPIVVKPPISRTWPAILSYCLIVGLLLWWFIRSYKSRTMLRASLEMERREIVRMEEANRKKMDFFINISNEFRTPLTLILSQLENLMRDKLKINRNRIGKIKVQASRMQELITEMLDFKKMEQNRLLLKVGNYNMTEFLDGIYNTFTDYAAEKQISFRYNYLQDSVILWFDLKQMQKVFYNLLSFMFRLASPKDSVMMSLHQKTGHIRIHIILKCATIDTKTINEFMDLINAKDEAFPEFSSLPDGTIGIAFSKGIIHLHQGEVTATKAENRMSLIVNLLTGNAHFKKEDLIAEKEVMYEPLSIAIEEVEEEIFWSEREETGDKKKYKILLVEDDPDMRMTLKETFSLAYEVIEQQDAELAFQCAIEEQPDVIISEIDLLGMSGMEMCKLLKSNVHTYHIPVILFTSYPSDEQFLESIRNGADYYFIKPFSMRILYLRCNYLIKNRKQIMNNSVFSDPEETDEMVTNEKDKDFLALVNQTIENHLHNTTFDTKQWSEEIGMGRTRLFSEIKRVTGMTPNDYLLLLKMNKSHQLLQENAQLTIAEVAYQLGFNNPHYFSRCFKKQFGLTPQAFKRKDKQSNDKDPVI